MKKMMSMAVVALLMAGSVAFACDTCGCKDKAKECEKPACCTAEKKCDKCTEEKKCDYCVKKAEEAKKAAETKEAEASE